MQRPRRTTEIVEETQQNTKRQSSRQQRSITAPSPAPGTAKKYAARQSRIAIPTRTSSLDRKSNANIAALVTLAPNSASRPQRSSSVAATLVAPTPQKTSLYKSPARSLLLTAEKYRGGVALHNDKRWVQDQMQRVSDYLRNEAARGAIPGFTPDFFNSRSGGLRQMSIKQFVGIVNYFLQFVCGNRFAVSLTNHVTDIVNILQKLEYPYQLNKSWLKTPNTQHSFGNVMLLFDFFMQFVPPQEDDVEAIERYSLPFLIPEEITTSRLEDEYQRIPDVEFQIQMLTHAEEGFLLWDKQLNQEFQALQTKTCDIFIQKRCVAEGLVKVEALIKKLEEHLVELEQQRPQIHKEDEQQRKSLKERVNNTQQKIEKLKDNIKAIANNIKTLKDDLPFVKNEVKSLQNEIKSMKETIDNQLCTVEERDNLINQVMNRKQILQSKERALQDLQDFNHNQQVLQSRTKNQLTEQIQKFNGCVRKIAYSQLNVNYSADDLQLPIQVSANDLQRVTPILNDLKAKVELVLKENKNTLHQFDQKTAEITYEIEYNLNPKTNSLAKKVNAAKENLQKYEEFAAQERSAMEQKEEQLAQQFQELKTQLEEREAELTANKQQLARLAEENEKTMCSIEQNYHKHADEREAYLDKYSAALEKANAELQELDEIVKSNELLINSIRNK